MYKISEKKAINMGKIQEIVKSSSIDCYINKEGNNYLGEIWNKKITILDARGNERDISLADKPLQIFVIIVLKRNITISLLW